MTSTPSPNKASPASPRPKTRSPSPPRSAARNPSAPHPARSRSIPQSSPKIPIPTAWASSRPSPPGSPPTTTPPASRSASAPRNREHARIVSTATSRISRASIPTPSGCTLTTPPREKITNGQRVRVFNDIGATIIPAEVTTRIAPGVVSIKEGAWYAPNQDGTDSQGCANALTTDRAAPCGATTYNTNQVQIEPA